MLARFGLSALLSLACMPALPRHLGPSVVDDATPGVFDYYLLSLSWSPNYCLTHEQDRAQCGGKGLGFVLHGLWPQFDAGDYPQYCRGEQSLSAQAAALGQTIYPSPKLMQHEWQSHGTCSGLDALSYFKTADRALASVQVPQVLEAPAHSLMLSGAQILAVFRDANPHSPENAVTVACSHGQLSEVRVCLTRELAPRSCGQRVRSSCPDGPVRIPSSR
jgi:ribonuclease T2